MVCRKAAEDLYPGAAGGLSRRSLLQAGAWAGLAAASGWAPGERFGRCGRAAALPAPPDFPGSIELYQQAYRNWSGEIRIPDLWTAAPRCPEEVEAIVNWAHRRGWRVRPKGHGHGWSPLLLPRGSRGERYLLVDTTRWLDGIRIERNGTPATVTAQAGITLEALLEQLGWQGLGFAATPAPGEPTLGGMLAVDAHGSGIPALAEPAVPGKGFGSLCNAVLALTAVVWDGGRYRLRAFTRDDPAIRPLLCHAGRAFVTEATLQVGADQNLRCRSFFDIPAGELFAAPGRAGSRSFQAWVDACGRAEAIWFPFTDQPWLKVWSPEPAQPAASLRLDAPYAYTFANWVTPAEDSFIDRLVRGHVEDTPAFQRLEVAAAISGLAVTRTWDLWGPSRYTTLYVKPSTLRLAENGYAVLAARQDIQRVVSEFCAAYRELLARYQAAGRFPMNGPIEIRVTGLDRAGEVLLPGAQEPRLSALRPRPDRPEWDCAVWLNALTFPGTPGENEFKTELEGWVLGNYTEPYACVRVEWAKGWAFTGQGAWTSPDRLGRHVPASFDRGQPPGDGWASALAALDRLDPHRVFSNPFLDRLMV
jgi:FAD/FMN-containing dehydrogenase